MPLTHVDSNGAPQMVDVSDKIATKRIARAEATVRLPEEVFLLIKENDLITPKGSVFHTAILAGTQAVKKTAELIPLCHTIHLEDCHIEIVAKNALITITCQVVTTAKTGVEMEALVGASIAALTIYDMTKALSHHISIESVHLVKKTGGKRDFG